MKFEKFVWNKDDFENMGWHDSRVYAITFSDNYELLFDIDYIFQWEEPDNEGNYFKFWVSPCTLVFENVHNLKFDIEISEPFRLEIDNIHYTNPQKPKNAEFIKKDIEYHWTIETSQGIITFISVGFKQYFRQSPILLNSQNISLELRKGISFSKNHDEK